MSRKAHKSCHDHNFWNFHHFLHYSIHCDGKLDGFFVQKYIETCNAFQFIAVCTEWHISSTGAIIGFWLSLFSFAIGMSMRFVFADLSEGFFPVSKVANRYSTVSPFLTRHGNTMPLCFQIPTWYPSTRISNPSDS